MAKVNLYHVSPHFNVQSILKQGVSPSFSRGKQRVSWWCTEENLMWALAHISSRYAISTNMLAVFVGSIDEERLVKTRWKGVYQTREAVAVAVASAAKNAIQRHEDALQAAQTLADFS